MPAKTVKTAPKNKNHPCKWKPGQSGNPKGRAVGSKNKVTRAAKHMIEGETEALTRKAIEMALGGDQVALRICMDRIYPKPKDAPIHVKLPRIAAPQDLPRAMAALFSAVATGKLTPNEARAMASIVHSQGQALELADIDKRITALEKGQ